MGKCNVEFVWQIIIAKHPAAQESEAKPVSLYMHVNVEFLLHVHFSQASGRHLRNDNLPL